jgi:hypothetical protein
MTVVDDAPLVLTVPAADPLSLPFGPLDPDHDRTLELGLRRIVREQVGIDVGYVEQLYTFGDRTRDRDERIISIAYLALTRPVEALAWADCYELLPWEDRRARVAPELETIEQVLGSWAGGAESLRERSDVTFGLNGLTHDPARVLERYELLYEVGLVRERLRDFGEDAGSEHLGRAMALDHRRMVATALGRLRGKLTYRPVVFELLSDEFTLSRLQTLVESLSGVRLHTSNFRRLVERAGLVEATGNQHSGPVGRPAALYRFRREVLKERPAPGVGLPR